MRESITGIASFESEQEETRSRGLGLTIGVIAALLVASLLVGGYTFLRRRHAQQVIAASAAEAPAVQARVPPKAQILVDEAMLKGDQTIIGGTVRNISNGDLTGLSVHLELKRRKNGATETASVPIAPPQLKPQQEGRYSLQLRSTEYSMVKLVALKSSSDSAMVAFTQLPGQKRPPEKLEPKVVGTRSGPADGFLNSPDNPARVP
jgi:hypothetical protein